MIIGKQLPIIVKLYSTSKDPNVLLYSARIINLIINSNSPIIDKLFEYNIMSAVISHLTDVNFIDVTEISLSIVNGLAKYNPHNTFQSVIIPVILQFMEFFPIETQRIALTACSYLSKVVDDENYINVLPAIPIFINILSYNDTELVRLSATCLENFLKTTDSIEEISLAIFEGGIIDKLYCILSHQQHNITITEEIIILCYNIFEELSKCSSEYLNAILSLDICKTFNLTIHMKCNDVSQIKPIDIQSPLIQSLLNFVHNILPNVNITFWSVLLKLNKIEEVGSTSKSIFNLFIAKRRKYTKLTDDTVKSITKSVKSMSITEPSINNRLYQQIINELFPFYSQIIALSSSINYNTIYNVYYTVAQLFLGNKDSKNIKPDDIAVFVANAFSSKDKNLILLYLSVLSYNIELFGSKMLDSIVRMGIIELLLKIEKKLSSYKVLTNDDYIIVPPDVSINNIIEMSTSLLINQINSQLTANGFEKDSNGNYTSKTMKILTNMIECFNDWRKANINNQSSEIISNKCIDTMKIFVKSFVSGSTISGYEINKSNFIENVYNFLIELPKNPEQKDYDNRRDRIDAFVSVIMDGNDKTAFSTILKEIHRQINISSDFHKDLSKPLSESEALRLINKKMQVQFICADEKLESLPQTKLLSKHPLAIDPFLPISTVETYVLEKLNQSISNASSPFEIPNIFICDECDSPIYAERYVCNDCDGYTLCSLCYTRRFDFHDEDHEFSKIEGGRVKNLNKNTKDKSIKNIKLKIYNIEVNSELSFIDYAMKMDWTEPNDVWNTVHKVYYTPTSTSRRERRPVIQLFKTEFEPEEFTKENSNIKFKISNPLDEKLIPVSYPSQYHWSNSLKSSLNLLKVLYTINQHLKIYHSINNIGTNEKIRLSSSFKLLNEKVCSIFKNQICDPLIVFKRPPIWCEFMVETFPFLLSIDLKKLYCDILTVDTKRAISSILKTYSSQKKNINQSLIITPILLTVSRSKAILTAMELFKLHLHNKFEFRFSGEEGTGDGPTSEFYSIISKEIQSKELGLWHDLSIKPSKIPLWKQQLNCIFNPLGESKYHRIAAYICKNCNCLLLPSCPNHKQLFVDIRDEKGKCIFIIIFSKCWLC